MAVAVFMYILINGTIYFARRSSNGDDAMIKLLTERLVSTSQDTTFEAIYALASNWRQQDDVTNPLHDGRPVAVDAVWTFDLDKDILRLDDRTRNMCARLDHFRHGQARISDYFKPYEPPKVRHSSMLAFFEPFLYGTILTFAADAMISKRKTFVVSRLLTDFASQWRHILLDRFREKTFARFATAFVRIAAMDFGIVECNLPRRGKGGARVGVHDLPEWEPFAQPVVESYRIPIVISRHMPHAMTLIKNDFGEKNLKRKLQRPSNSSDDFKCVYLIFSIKEVILYRLSDQSPMACSKPELLFDATGTLSPNGIELLLKATYLPIPRSRLQKLPVEIQDMILDNLGPIDRERIGCALDVGSEFDWKRKDGNPIEVQNGHTHRHPGLHVETEIWFDDCFAGLCYK